MSVDQVWTSRRVVFAFVVNGDRVVNIGLPADPENHGGLDVKPRE